MITLNHVTKRYRSNIGLDDVSVKINKGDFVFLVGPSGAGKSTFIKLILKEINADSGQIVVGDFDVTKMSNRKIPIFRRRLGTVFQDFRLLEKKTVYENVAFAMEVIHKPSRLIRKQVPQVLSLVGISDKAHKYPNELSAGEQQRVAIARAIVNNPQVLIADEPTGNLDPDTAWEIMDLLDQINLRGTTILMVTHAKDIVDRMNKRVIAIEKGKIVRDEKGEYGYQADSYDGAENENFDYYDEEDGQVFHSDGAALFDDSEEERVKTETEIERERFSRFVVRKSVKPEALEEEIDLDEVSKEAEEIAEEIEAQNEIAEESDEAEAIQEEAEEVAEETETPEDENKESGEEDELIG